MPRQLAVLLLPALALGGCAGDRPVPCGFTHFAGATMLLEQFRIPNQTLSVPPSRVPERVVARFAAGGAYPAIIGRVDTALAVGVEGDLPAGVEFGYGVLVVGPEGAVRGLVLYEGDVIPGAPLLGTVTMGAVEQPLIGLMAPPDAYEDATCPLFPDSVLR